MSELKKRERRACVPPRSPDGAARAPGFTLYDFFDPAWSLDGTRLVAVTPAGGSNLPDPTPCDARSFNYELRLIDATTGTLGPWLTCHLPHATLSDAVTLGPTWTPDGQTVVFFQAVSAPEEFGSDLWEVQPGASPDPATGVPPRRRLTQDPAAPPPTGELYHTVAPDGKTVAFDSDALLPGPPLHRGVGDVAKLSKLLDLRVLG